MFSVEVSTRNYQNVIILTYKMSLDSVDLDSFRVQRTHDSLQLSLEATDSEVEGIGSGVAIVRDPEQDFLSNIIDDLNDAYQTDFTMEDKVDIETIHRKSERKRGTSARD